MLATLTYQVWRLKDCEGLRKQARIPPIMLKEERACGGAEALQQHKAYTFLENDLAFPRTATRFEFAQDCSAT